MRTMTVFDGILRLAGPGTLALERLSEALWFETQHFGVRVVVVASGGIRTGILTRQQRFSLDAYTPLVEQCERVLLPKTLVCL
jgi:NAD(P)-dependent dehydrogenase (short-subunit alcohol dehydrogenase family)